MPLNGVFYEAGKTLHFLNQRGNFVPPRLTTCRIKSGEDYKDRGFAASASIKLVLAASLTDKDKKLGPYSTEEFLWNMALE
jgi:hypothetical protein